MSFSSRPSPARVTAAAARKLPRILPLGLPILFLLIGLWGRDPWPDDGILLGTITTLADGSARDFWLPGTLGSPLPALSTLSPLSTVTAAVADSGAAGGSSTASMAAVSTEGPLAGWAGAALVRLSNTLLPNTLFPSGWQIDAFTSARVLALGWFALASLAIWYATFGLGRRNEAQPVALAFGGQADSRDYGRMVADNALLLMVGTLGLALRWHEVTALAPTVAVSAMAVGAVVWAMDRPLRGGVLAGCAVAGLALLRGPVPALGLLLGCLLAIPALRWRTGLALLGAAGVLTLAWPLGAHLLYPEAAGEYFGKGLPFWGVALHLANLDDGRWLLRNAAWFLWPLWPLAAWAVYAWRRSRPYPQIRAPLALLSCQILTSAASTPLDSANLAAWVPPLAVLAGFGAVALRRGAENLLDWLEIAFFTLAMVFVWSYFLAFTFGVPQRMAASVIHLVPGFKAATTWPMVLLAIAASLAWIALVAWRILRRPAERWTGSLLAASGTVSFWLLLTALFLPAFNYSQSHRELANQLDLRISQARAEWMSAHRQRGENLADPDCVQPHRVPLAMRELIEFDSTLRFGRDNEPRACVLALQRSSARAGFDDGPPPGSPGSWKLLADLRRPARPDEIWRVWERADTRP